MPKAIYCDYCERKVLGVYKYPNFMLHAFLLTLSCGLYLPFWLMAMSQQVYLCPRCGEKGR